jgi:hypothetical protein
MVTEAGLKQTREEQRVFLYAALGQVQPQQRRCGGRAIANGAENWNKRVGNGFAVIKRKGGAQCLET